MITGESRPVKKTQGDEVIAGTVNGAGSLRVEVTGTGRADGARRHHAPGRAGAERRARARRRWPTGRRSGSPRGLAAGAVTFVVWLALAGRPGVRDRAVVTVLVISCPHALGLAVPLVIAISTTLGARSGLLVRDRRGLEEARNSPPSSSTRPER